MGYPGMYGNYGDYYSGDYYSGDIFGSIFGGIKKVAGAVGSLIPGPVGTVARAIAGTPKAPTAPATLNLPEVRVGAIRSPSIGITMPSLTTGAGMPSMAAAAGGACGGPGYHRNKALARWERAVARGSSAQRPHVVNQCVKNRQMNPLNPRSLRRAIRRQQSMKAMMTRVLKGTGYKITRSGTGTTRRRKR